jgi:hypothetical protein
MRTPRAAAVAGILFSVLFSTSQLLIWLSVPTNPLGPATDVVQHSETISLALNLLPFAGIAFLWFIAVVRDRLGELEDRFFTTVFLGSGLLYIAMVFHAAAIAGGVILVLGKGSENLVQSGAYTLARLEIQQIMHIYAARMAGVFMISTSTIFVQTRIVARWMALLGYVLALVLLLSVGKIAWIPLIFPAWVFLVSLYILKENLQARPEGPQAAGAVTRG